MSATTQHSDTGIELIRNDLDATLLLQRTAYLANPYPSLEERRADLRQLKAFVRDNRDAIVDAINMDYGNRSRHETLFAEIFSVLDGVDHTLKHLKKWMKPQRRHVDLKNFFGASNRVIPQPLGVVGAIVPWNFPINLSFNGLIATFAAGNRSMVKMSENSRHLAKLLIDKCPTYFPRDKLAFFDALDTVQACLELAPSIVRRARLRVESINARLEEGFLDATTLMEYLIGRGVPMRTGHEVVGKLVRLCESKKCRLADLTLAELQQANETIEAGVSEYIGVKNVVARLCSFGSGGRSSVLEQVAAWRQSIGMEPG